MRLLKDLKKDEIKQAIGDYIEANGPTPGYRLASPVAMALGADLGHPDSLGIPGQTATQHAQRYRTTKMAQDQFHNKVYRIANEMADDGELLKVGKGGVRPNGARTHNQAYYYTQFHWDAETAATEKRRDAILAREQEWKDIRKRLLLGPGVTLTDDQHRLSLGEWEKLLNAAGW